MFKKTAMSLAGRALKRERNEYGQKEPAQTEIRQGLCIKAYAEDARANTTVRRFDQI